MKKVLCFVIIITMVFSATPFAVASESVSQEDYEALQNAYNELQGKYDELLTDYENLLATVEETQGNDEVSDNEAALSIEGTSEYDTGISFEQLSRTPDKYVGSKVKFTGTVLQILEGTDENQGRMSTSGAYDDVIYFGYNPSILDVRLLNNDVITIYGESYGLWSYETVLGATITLPCIWVEKIEFGSSISGTASGVSVFNKDDVLSQLEVTELKYSSRYSNYAFLVIRNNSEYTLEIKANVSYYDGNGNLVGANSASEKAVESGYSTILRFRPDDDYDTMEYTLSVKEETYYKPVLSDISYEGTMAKNKVILAVTNNGTEAAEFVQGTVLFYAGGKLVDYDWTYFTDSDSEIKPGETIMKELKCYNGFDSYEVYFSGRR